MKTVINLILCIPLLALLATGNAISGIATESTNPEANKAFLRGWQAYRQGTPDDLTKAITDLELAIELDPDFSPASSALAAAYWDISLNGWSKSLNLFPSEAREQSRLSLAVAMKQPSALSIGIAAERAALFYRKPTIALAEAARAIDLDANDPAGHLAMATALLKANKPADAADSIHTAMLLDPQFPASYLTRLGQAELMMGQYEKASMTLEKAAKRNPDNDWNFVYLAAAYGYLALDQKATIAIDMANTLRAKAGWGELTIQTIGVHRDSGGRRYYLNWFGDLKPLREGLIKAGVPRESNWHNLIITNDSGNEVKGAVTIDAKTAKSLHERDVPFVDIWFLYMQGRISGAHYLDVWTYEFNNHSLGEIARKDQEIVIYSSRDDVGRWGPQAVARAVSWGYEKIYFMNTGLGGWKAAGYPVETTN